MRPVVILLLLQTFRAQGADSIQSHSLSPTGRFVLVQEDDGNVWLADGSVPNKKPFTTNKRLTGGASRAEFIWAPDERSFYVVQAGRMQGYSLPSVRAMKANFLSQAFSDVQLSPNGRYLAAVSGNNLTLITLDKQVKAVLQPLTVEGGNNLLVGIPDPIYETEFRIKKHFWWSPDSSSIAFIETQFLDEDHFVVPGARLPVFSLKIINVNTKQVNVISESDEAWPYLMRVAWRPDSKALFFYRMNRLQTTADLCSWESGGIKTVVSEGDAYWLNTPETPKFVDHGKQFVISSERSGARHLYLYQLSGKQVRDLTPGLEVAHLFEAQDEEHLYFEASGGGHREQQGFRSDLIGHTEQFTQNAGRHQISLSNDGKVYLDYHSSAAKPPTLEWHVYRGETRELWASSTELQPVIGESLMIKTHDQIELPARLLKPADFDSKQKYPIILYVFAGPEGNVAKDEWDGWQMQWNRSMTKLGFLVLAVDVRGSGGYGHLFEEYIHYRLGAQETADLREVVSYLHQLKFVDGDRIGIWGRDYGAHTVVHAMWEFPGGFKAGFADSPIADWKTYDAYFTERYLGLPSTRFNEYKDSSPVSNARRMTGTLMVTTDPHSMFIHSDHLAALQKAIAGVKNPQVPKRFHVVPYPASIELLKEQLTEFFKSTL